MKNSIILLMFLLFSFSVNSQITVFNKTYDTDTTIEGNNGIIPISGGYITIDGIIFNKNGHYAHIARILDEKGNEKITYILDEGTKKIVTINGGEGFIQSSDGAFLTISAIDGSMFDNGQKDYFVIKFTAEGEVIWKHQYEQNGTQFPTAIIETADKGYLVVGNHHNNTYSKFNILKINSEGKKQWQVYYGLAPEEGNSVPFSAAQTSDGGYLVSGYGFTDGANYQMYLIKIDSKGYLKWQKDWGGWEGNGGGLISRIDNKYYIIGSSVSDNKNCEPIFLEIDEEGNVLVENIIQTKNSILSHQLSLRPFTNNTLITAGYYAKSYSELPIGLIMCFTTAGDTLWTRTIPTGINDENYFRDVRPTPDGGFVAAGFLLNSPQRSWVVKFDADGHTCAEVGCDSVTFKNCLGYYTQPQLSFTTIHIGNGLVAFYNLSQQVYTDEPGGGYYLWQFGDGTEQISNSNESVVHTYPSNTGSYTATLNAILCGDTTQLTQTVQLWAVGTQQIPQHAAQSTAVLSQNPIKTGQAVTVHYAFPPQIPQGQFNLYNIQGRLVGAWGLPSLQNQRTLPTLHLAAGIYPYEVKLGNRVIISGKLVIN
ncbi:MAG: PKD domain-containing protein [Sphingobacteriales bacterium]|jgi:hypothetical protein|nr:PKD domain-containing protein [Sphingobacteriales bacterium]MBP9141471.1 PKD domain-containing protein [Chitinophagales bacterium]MDA0198057.1 PKD domain-containing protein [Bacteroidota bacterium]MBK6891149.1 PKD domain-containing protein [Sphingobacteriales bacterium]MBK7527025.1 PKD domain-containing protein [Sphingobacteriales bacterium]